MSEFNLKLDYYGLLNLHKALLEAIRTMKWYQAVPSWRIYMLKSEIC